MLATHRRNPLRHLALRGCALLCQVLLAGATSARDPAGDPFERLDTLVLERVEVDAPVVTDLVRTRDGLLWLATDEGLWRLDGRRAERFDRDRHPTLTSETITHLATDWRERTLFVGTREGGLLRFDGVAFRAISRPNSVGGPWTVTALLSTPEGTLWIGTPDALLGVERGAGSASHGLPGVGITALTRDAAGQIWAAAGPSLFRRAQNVFQPIPFPLGLDAAAIHDVAVTGAEEVWLAREDGLVRLAGDFRGVGLPRSAEAIDGLDAPARAVLEDAAGRLWAADDTRLNRRGATGEWQSIDLPAPATALYEEIDEGSRTSAVWIATRGAGVLRLSPPEDTGTLAVPEVAILHLAFGGRSVPPGASRVLEPGIETIEIRATAPSFRRPEEITLAWRLDDGSWTPAAHDGTILLRGLPSGRHRVEVRAERAGRPGPTTAVELELSPRLVETGAFWLVVVSITVFLAGLWLFFAWRRRREEAWLAAQEAEDREDLEMLDDSTVTLGPRRIVRADRGDERAEDDDR